VVYQAIEAGSIHRADMLNLREAYGVVLLSPAIGMSKHYCQWEEHAHPAPRGVEHNIPCNEDCKECGEPAVLKARGKWYCDMHDPDHLLQADPYPPQMIGVDPQFLRMRGTKS
jgi:hypothetical protein